MIEKEKKIFGIRCLVFLCMWTLKEYKSSIV